MDRDLLLIEEMIDSAEQAAALVAGVTVAELAADRVRGDALLRNLTVLGEAAAQVSQPTKMRFAGVPWRQPARLRNRIVHGYWSIDLQIAHTTADQQLPAFAAQQQPAWRPCRTMTGTPRMPASVPIPAERLRKLGHSAHTPCSPPWVRSL